MSQQVQDADDDDDDAYDLFGPPVDRQKIDQIQYQNDNHKRDQDVDEKGHRSSPLTAAVRRRAGGSPRRVNRYQLCWPGKVPSPVAENSESAMRRLVPVLLIMALAVSLEPAAANDRAPTGTLRAAFIATNPVQAVTDPAPGEVRGPSAELARELARRLGLPFRIAGAPGVAGVLDSVKKGESDIGFLAFDPVRAAEVDFSQPYALAQNTYVVLDRSPIRSVAEVDRAGIRIGVAARDAGDLFLSRNLKAAELVRNPGGTLDHALAKLRAGEIDAYAGNRQRRC